MNRLTYSVVFVTRNRLDAISLSLPLVLQQSIPPAQVVVVDSSDDPAPIKAIVDGCGRDFGFEIDYIYSQKPGISLQRNIGLARVTEPIVIYSDDDSLFFPDAVEQILGVYEQDRDNLVAAVCGAEAAQPLEEWQLGSRSQYQMRWSDRVRRGMLPAIRFLTEKLVRDPLLVSIDQRYTELKQPSDLLDDEVVTVPYMTGFRMSFRTAVLREFGFNELLGRYSLGEDILASVEALSAGVVIGARNAKIYHHRAPARRDNGFNMGVSLILNRIYILGKLGYFDRHSRVRFWMFYILKLAGFLASATSVYGRAKFRGGLTALVRGRQLLSSHPETLDTTFKSIRQELITD